jgi:hypothetical protein
MEFWPKNDELLKHYFVGLEKKIKNQLFSKIKFSNEINIDFFFFKFVVSSQGFILGLISKPHM